MKTKVLAIDDEASILALLRLALDNEGFEVNTAQTIEKFRELNDVNDYELYLIDLNLKDGNGLSIVRELRHKTNKGIILLTGRSDEIDQVVGLESGADDYVTKPFRMRELAARMTAVCRRTKFSGNSIVSRPEAREGSEVYDFEFDGYRLQIAARTLWGSDGQEVPLTSAEFNLLVAFIERRGKVLIRDELMNMVKGQDWESYDRAVDGLVSRLRRKIQPPHQGPHYIRTVHGVGYLFTV